MENILRNPGCHCETPKVAWQSPSELVLE